MLQSVSEWRSFLRHDLSGMFPDMTEVEFEGLCSDMRENGFNPKQQILMFEGRVLDGWHQLRAAIVTSKMPTFDEYKGKDPLGEVIRRNLHRRHLSTTQRATIAADVVARSRNGEYALMRSGAKDSKISIEKAAEMLNVSTRSVDNALNVQTNGTPALQEAVKDGTVTLTDAAQIAKLPEKTIRDALKLITEQKPKKTRRKGGKGKKGKTATAAAAEVAKSEGDESKEELKDAEGHDVPDTCHEAFANLEKYKSIDSLTRDLQKQIDALSGLPGGEQLSRFLKPTGKEGDTINKSEHLNALKRDLKGTRPHCVCPWCKGKGQKDCKGCDGLAWVSKTAWDNADEQTKARLK